MQVSFRLFQHNRPQGDIVRSSSPNEKWPEGGFAAGVGLAASGPGQLVQRLALAPVAGGQAKTAFEGAAESSF